MAVKNVSHQSPRKYGAGPGSNSQLLDQQSDSLPIAQWGPPILHYHYYGKCSKISNTFLFLFPNKMMVITEDGIHKMLVGIANREDPDQTASSEAV